jgi:lysophospholipase L1-like esterase
MKEPNQVIVVSAGDSLTDATFSSDYLSILRKRLKGQHYEFVNAGQLGDTSENLLKRIDKDVLVSVQKQIESTESFVIQGRWPDS